MGEAIDVDDAFGNELVVELELVVVDVSELVVDDASALVLVCDVVNRELSVD